jgi:hypothetical protein
VILCFKSPNSWMETFSFVAVYLGSLFGRDLFTGVTSRASINNSLLTGGVFFLGQSSYVSYRYAALQCCLPRTSALKPLIPNLRPIWQQTTQITPRGFSVIISGHPKRDERQVSK